MHGRTGLSGARLATEVASPWKTMHTLELELNHKYGVLFCAQSEFFLTTSLAIDPYMQYHYYRANLIEIVGNSILSYRIR